MHGIDVSSWQAGIDLAAVPADFVIVKVTGGTGYVNPNARAQVDSARRAGKLIGLYHYAHEIGSAGSASAEARHFLRHALPLADDATRLVLDWEAASVIRGAGNVWAGYWLDHVAATAQKTPWLYSYLDALRAQTWVTVPEKYPLWLAWYGHSTPMYGYADDFTLPFTIPHGFVLTAWQYSQHGRLPGYDGDVDLNVFFGERQQWSD